MRQSSQRVQQFAQRLDAVCFQIGIIADVSTEEMDVVDLRIIFRAIEFAAQERLAQLIAATGETAAELDLAFAQFRFDAIPQGLIRFAQDERERVVATTFAGEVGVKLLRVEVVEEEILIARALFVVRIETLDRKSTRLNSSHT